MQESYQASPHEIDFYIVGKLMIELGIIIIELITPYFEYMYGSPKPYVDVRLMLPHLLQCLARLFLMVWASCIKIRSQIHQNCSSLRKRKGNRPYFRDLIQKDAGNLQMNLIPEDLHTSMYLQVLQEFHLVT